jgi:D-ribose pyranose/furanose isomerase RbsD
MPPNYKPITVTKEIAQKAIDTYARLIGTQENDDKIIILYIRNDEFVKIARNEKTLIKYHKLSAKLKN